MVGLIDTFASSPSVRMRPKIRTYSSVEATAFWRSVTSSPKRSRVAMAPWPLRPRTSRTASSSVSPAT